MSNRGGEIDVRFGGMVKPLPGRVTCGLSLARSLSISLSCSLPVSLPACPILVPPGGRPQTLQVYLAHKRYPPVGPYSSPMTRDLW